MGLLCSIAKLVVKSILMGYVSSLSPPYYPNSPSSLSVYSTANLLSEPEVTDYSFFGIRVEQNSGLDMRYGNDTSNNLPPESVITIEHLSRLQRKQGLLATLEDPYVSLRRKTILVEEEDILPINKLLPDLCAGGLMNDWDFPPIN